MADARTSDFSKSAEDAHRMVLELAAKAVALPHEPRRFDERPEAASEPRPAAPPRHGWFWWWCYAMAWLGVSALGVVAVLRITFHDGTYLLTCINAFTFYAYLPAYAVLAWAIYYRRWWLSSVTGLAVLCHVVWVAPDFAPAMPLEAETAETSPVIKIFYANIAGDNYDRFGFLREVEEADADIVVLVEYFRWWHQHVMDWPFIQNYQYGTGLTVPFAPEIAFFSKLPMTRVERHRPAGSYVDLFDVQVGSETLRIVALHSPRPMNLPGHDYVGFWNEAAPLIAAQPEPLVVIGDFNATQHSKLYQRLTATRLRSAHRDRGRGWATTWPNGEFPAPPIRIDQALLSPEVECLRIVEGRGRGSDHRPLILDVRLRGE